MRKSAKIVSGLVGEDNWVGRMLGEASVHRPHRGRIYVATYTGPAGGPCWKSTGTDDPTAAIVIAREFEAAARAERAQAGGVGQPQRIRNRQSPGNPGAGLTQREVAQLLGMTERGVRAVEKRALRKLWQNPLLRKLWREYLRGELIEHAARLSTAELQVLVGLARSHAERETLQRVFAIIQN
jgi:hypothetical protein